MSKRGNKTRNLLHNHPLLRKGGMHEKSRKAKRRSDKQALRKAWFYSSMCIAGVCIFANVDSRVISCGRR